MTNQAQILPGTLELLILRAVSLGPLHGYGILLRIGQISGNALLIEQGALYPGTIDAPSSMNSLLRGASVLRLRPIIGIFW